MAWDGFSVNGERGWWPGDKTKCCEFLPTISAREQSLGFMASPEAGRERDRRDVICGGSVGLWIVH